MDYQGIARELDAIGVSYKKETPIAPYTTFRIGGNADLLCLIDSLPQLHDTILICKKHKIPFKVLGGGSNVLVSDRGFRGVIIINKAKGWEILENAEIPDLKAQTLQCSFCRRHLGLRTFCRNSRNGRWRGIYEYARGKIVLWGFAGTGSNPNH